MRAGVSVFFVIPRAEKTQGGDLEVQEVILSNVVFFFFFMYVVSLQAMV